MLKVLADDEKLLTILREDQRLNNSIVIGVNLINMVNPNDSNTSLAIEASFHSQTEIPNEQPILLLRFEPVTTYSFGPSFTSYPIQSCKFFRIEQDYYFSFSPNSSSLEIEYKDANFIRANSVKGYTFIVV